MGIADLRSAFNDIAGFAGITCARAELSYEPHEGIQFQRLTFRGTDAAGQPFVQRSERLRPETDVIAATRDVATKMVTEAEGKAK
jgi:hypothetical protein